ncbi:MAG: hypothetical protein L0Z53_24845 [Acidobacteriales bacterium]|nr:hypothetical protein [Terriglobales bacterium]
MSVLRHGAIESIRAAKNAIPGVKPLIAEALGADWTTALRQWLSELEAYGIDAKRTFPADERGMRCAVIIQQIEQMASELENADCTPLDDPSRGSCVETGSMDGEWSNPMPKAKMAMRLGLSPRQFATFIKSHELKERNRQLWQIRLDTLDRRTRQQIEGPEA